MKRRYIIITGPNGQPISATGQVDRALRALVHAGAKGVTALEISSWALRLSHYIFMLRTRHGLVIEMTREPHGDGADGRWHGRYVLRSPVTIRDVAS